MGRRTVLQFLLVGPQVEWTTLSSLTRWRENDHLDRSESKGVFHLEISCGSPIEGFPDPNVIVPPGLLSLDVPGVVWRGRPPPVRVPVSVCVGSDYGVQNNERSTLSYSE